MHMHNSDQTSSHRDLVPHCSTQIGLGHPKCNVTAKLAEFQQMRHFSLGAIPSPGELEHFEGVH